MSGVAVVTCPSGLASMVLSHPGRFVTTPLTRDAATSAAEQLKVFAQAQQLVLVSALVGRELTVGTIDQETGIGQPALSQQLAELRRAGLVTQRREAKQVLYCLADARTTAIVRFIGTVFGGEGEPLAALRAIERPATRSRAVSAAAMFAVVDDQTGR